MNAQARMGVGAVLATFGALAVVLSSLLGWPDAARPWGFLSGFLAALLCGLGGTICADQECVGEGGP